MTLTEILFLFGAVVFLVALYMAINFFIVRHKTNKTKRKIEEYDQRRKDMKPV